MSAMASQITRLRIVYSKVYSGVDHRRRQSSASLVFGRGIHRWPVNSAHKGPVTWKMFSISWRHNGQSFSLWHNAFLCHSPVYDGLWCWKRAQCNHGICHLVFEREISWEPTRCWRSYKTTLLAWYQNTSRWFIFLNAGKTTYSVPRFAFLAFRDYSDCFGEQQISWVTRKHRAVLVVLRCFYTRHCCSFGYSW